MKTSRQTDFYDIRVDRDKNRVHVTIKGNWHKYEDVKDFVNACEDSCTETTPGFTILFDLTKARDTAFPELLRQSMEAYVRAGFAKSAELYDEQMLLHLPADTSNAAATPLIKQFSSRESAEAWLDAK